ncbi:MAG TPA: sensor domain-containing diguanylate cyclase [Syntrophobacteraceae bacterium]|nr:sensor domain-containing diguanylate cyclase [Syntrophobacteraceae bacterium]
MTEMTIDYKELLDQLYDGVYFVDGSRRILYWNRAAEKITGFSAAEVFGKSCSQNILCHVDEHGSGLCMNDCPLEKVIADGVPRDAEVYLHHKDGHRTPVSIHITPVLDARGQIVGAVELFADNTPQANIRARIAELEELVMLDPLTRLGNRRFIELNIQSRLDEMDRYQLSFGLLFLDIDQFKNINDGYGHESGDKILKMVATTLASNSRPFDVFGRWGGEEFIGIVRQVDRQSLYAIAERLRELVRTSFIMEGENKIQVTVSLGVCFAHAGDTLETLIKRADELMYQSKARGRDQVTMDAADGT